MLLLYRLRLRWRLLLNSHRHRRWSLDLLLHRWRLCGRLLGGICLESLLRKEICNERISSAFADLVDPRLRLLNSETHAVSIQQRQEGIGSVVSLLLSDAAGRGRRGRSAGLFNDFLHSTIFASTKVFVHLHDSIRKLLDLSATHIAMLLL